MEKIYKEDMHDVTPEEAKTWILDYYNSKITTDYMGTNTCDYIFESVYTADSYTVYWAHANDDYGFNPENVYYYANGLVDEIIVKLNSFLPASKSSSLISLLSKVDISRV